MTAPTHIRGSRTDAIIGTAMGVFLEMRCGLLEAGYQDALAIKLVAWIIIVRGY